MRGIEYTVRYVTSGRAMPTGKVPYVEIDGQLLADSGLIISELEKRLPAALDAGLTEVQQAEALAMRRMLEEHLYWAVVYSRWLDPDGSAGWGSLVTSYFGMPKLVLALAGPLLRRRVRGHLHSQGFGRHASATMWALAEADVRALSAWLADRPWAFADKATSLDACIAAFTATAIGMPWDYPLKRVYQDCPNLVRHLDQVLQTYFPELQPLP